MSRVIVQQSVDGTSTLWRSGTLKQFGLQEADLEAALCETPDLLCLETRATGVYGPFAVINRPQLPTPQGRLIEPDIVLLAASGDVVIVEVKRFGNRELENRSVISQAIDYVSSLSALGADDLARFLNGGLDAAWLDVVAYHFPEESDLDELAGTIMRNASSGNVHIVIACDRVPLGVHEQARSVSAQTHLGFSLDIVEVTPYVVGDTVAQGLMFVPHVRLGTEIVFRSAVTVRVEGATESQVIVKTTSLDELQDELGGPDPGEPRVTKHRYWKDQEIEDAVMGSDDPTVHELFRFAREEGFGGQIQGGGKRVSAGFGFYMAVPRGDGTVAPYQVFTWVDGRRKLSIYMNWESVGVRPEVLAAYRNELHALFGVVIDRPEPNVSVTEIGDNLDGFEAAVRKLQAAVLPPRGV